MRVREANWAAQVPYLGIQDFPELLARIAADGIKIDDVEGLAAALAAAGGGVGTVTWASITGKPTFGSGAFANVTDFATAAQGALADTALQPADVLGTAGEITATPAAGSVTLSLPMALTLTGKTITGGAFDPESVKKITGGVQALSGPGAVDLVNLATDFTSTGAGDALTLANGAVGDLKMITHVVAGGTGVLTPATAVGFSTITFNNAGESAFLRFTSAGWALVSEPRGAVVA